jgi:hypothetical protein
MTAPDAAAEERRWRKRRRAALLAWAVLGIVIWNVVFDAVVIQAGREYLTRQALHQQGRGPAVTIPQVMRPAVARGAFVATLAGGGAAAFGAIAVWMVARHRRRRLSRPGEQAALDLR